MSAGAAVFVALASPPAAAQAEVTEAYRCGVSFEIDGLTGGMWRDFEPARPDDFYIIQLQNPAVDHGPFAIWKIDNRPPARPRDYGWQFGRPEAVVFEQGPDSISFGMVEHGEVRDGPLWARVYGDGAYAGTIFVRRARDTRRSHRHGGRAVSVSISQYHYPQIVARLAPARSWEAILVDSDGRELGRRTVRVPAPADARAAFVRARAELLDHRRAFLVAGGGFSDDAPCSTLPHPDSTI